MTEQLTSNITLHDSRYEFGEQVIRIDKEGFHYRGQFIADAGEAHRLMVEFLRQNTRREPQGPTDEKLEPSIQQTDQILSGLEHCFGKPSKRMFMRQWIKDWTRHRLDRYARPAIEPVPVAERLPGPEDCDAEGVCWWWHPDHTDEEFGDGWILLKSEWADGYHDADGSLIYTHWLPHHALPVPQQEADLG